MQNKTFSQSKCPTQSKWLKVYSESLSKAIATKQEQVWDNDANAMWWVRGVYVLVLHDLN